MQKIERRAHSRGGVLEGGSREHAEVALEELHADGGVVVYEG